MWTLRNLWDQSTQAEKDYPLYVKVINDADCPFPFIENKGIIGIDIICKDKKIVLEY